MKYCGRFSNKIDMKVFNEISIQYNKQDRNFIQFLQEHQGQRVIAVISDIEDFNNSEEWIKLNAIKKTMPDFDFAVCFSNPRKFEMINPVLKECFKNLEVPYFTGHVATNFDQLHYLCKEGVSDVYLGEEIGFDLRRAKAVASAHGVKIRVFPNVAQASVSTTPPLKKFFIRPEDAKAYEDCVDVFEFWGPLDRQKVLYKIYTKGFWRGDLKDLFLDFDLSFDSKRVMPEFAQSRKTCDRKCMKGYSCSICDLAYNISKKLEKEQLIIDPKYNH